LGELREGVEGGAILGGELAIGEAEEVGDGVNDDEGEVGELVEDAFEVVEGIGDFVGGGEGVEVGKEVDARGIGAEGVETGAVSGGEVVIGGEEEGVGGWEERGGEGGGCGAGGLRGGEGAAGGEACGEVLGDEGLACAGVGAEEGDFSAGDVVLPEPGERSRFDGRECNDGHEKSPQ